MRVELKPHAETNGVEIRLPIRLSEFATISGRVIDDLGQPIRGATILCGEVVQSDRNGEFVLRNANPAVHEFHAVTDDRQIFEIAVR